jgi:hypothetical protein
MEVVEQPDQLKIYYHHFMSHAARKKYEKKLVIVSNFQKIEQIEYENSVEESKMNLFIIFFYQTNKLL